MVGFISLTHSNFLLDGDFGVKPLVNRHAKLAKVVTVVTCIDEVCVPHLEKIIRIVSYGINLIATVVIATIRQNSAHQRCAIRATPMGFLENCNRLYLNNFCHPHYKRAG